MTSVLHLHHPDDERYSLRYLNPDPDARAEKVANLREKPDIDILLTEETVDGQCIYLAYTRTVADAAQPDFETAADVSEWADRSFSATDRQIVIVVARIFHGILDEKDAQGEDLAIYKQMNLEAIPDILNRVEWRQSVPEVGAELLSRFILAHPMPNTNHRTGIGLLDRYLSSYDETFAMPDTGEDDRWYDWVRDYIHDSKRLLTLRNYYPVLQWAARYGYDAVERKEGIRIEFETLNFDRDDYRDYHTDRHLDRSRRFVNTVLEETQTTHLREKIDDGKRAFGDRLRGAGGNA